jgi:WD40 repeat protein
MEVTRSAFCSPVTAIATLQEPPLILCSQGPSLFIYRHDGSLAHVEQLDPIGSHNISGLSLLSNQRVALYGGKRVKVVHLVSECHWESTFQLGPLADLVLDVCEVHHMALQSFLVGYAQNYIDIFNLVDGSLRCTVRSTIACVLFSMTIFVPPVPGPDPSLALIASGTAFGKIVLWSMPNLSLDSQRQPSSVLEGHTGVIFRMKWRTCPTGRRLLASVSDDRSVRVWDVSSLAHSSCLFVGWGHICRVWDVLFLETGRLVTCSEDATIKLWELDLDQTTTATGRCITTMAGHGKNVWRIALLQVPHAAASSTTIISAGNDGAIKLWPVDVHGVLSEKIAPISLQDSTRLPFLSAYKSESLIPESGAASAPLSRGNRRMNCAAGLSVSPDGEACVVVLLDGTTWAAEMKRDGIRWVYVQREPPQESDSQSGVTGVSVLWSPLVVAVAAIRANGTAQLTLLRYPFPGGETTVPTLSALSWEAHRGKGINTWLLRADPNAWYDVMTCSVGGVCSVVRISVCATSSDLALLVTSSQSFSTTSLSIATAASLIAAHHHQLLVVGDCRGSLSVFNVESLVLESNSSQTLEPACCYQRAHGLEVVSCVSALGESASSIPGFCSLGHDGHLNVYALETHEGGSLRLRVVSRSSCLPVTAPDQVFFSGAGVDSSVYICGFQASEYLVWDVRRKYQLVRVEAGGWKRPHFSALQHPVSAAGFPSIAFAVLSPSGNNTKATCLRYDQSLESPSRALLPLQFGVPGHGKVAYAATFLSSGGSSSSSPAVVAVGGEDGSVKLFRSVPSSPSFQFLQEAQMPMNAPVRAMAHCPSPCNTADRVRGIVVAGGGKLSYSVWSYDLRPPLECGALDWPLLSVLQPLCSSMMGTPSRKRNNSRRKAKETRAGQRQRVESAPLSQEEGAEREADVVEPEREEGKDSNSEPTISSFGASEDQDHRILSVSTTACALSATLEGRAASTEDNYLAMLGDSKGLATLLLIDPALIAQRTRERAMSSPDENSGRLGAVVLEEFHASEYPLLANNLLSVPFRAATAAPTASEPQRQEIFGNIQLGVFGDTTGGVSLWHLCSSSVFGR